jgi:DTW domain-containing protein YfiP
LTLTYNIKDTKSLKKNFKKFKNTFLRQKQRHSDTKETGRRERERERERE